MLSTGGSETLGAVGSGSEQPDAASTARSQSPGGGDRVGEARLR